MTGWTKLVNCGSGFEAELIAARLRSAGLRVQVRGNDIVGIFGPGFQGPTSRGVDVLVPESELAAARETLAEIQETE